MKKFNIRKLIPNPTKALAFVGLLALTFGCADDFQFEENRSEVLNVKTRANASSLSSASGLVLQDDGTWLATRRIPLVGQGRILDNQMKALVTVGATNGGSEGRGENVIDLDLTNTAIPRGDAVDASVGYNSILSVRDVNYVYSGGQKAGFVVKKDGSGLLTADLLKSYTVATYLKGEPQEEKSVVWDSGLLDLAIGNITVVGDNAVPLTLEAEFEKPFDEVRLSNAGVKAGAGETGIEIYYAFVGETEMIKAINDGNTYFNNNCSGKFDGVNNNGLVDTNLTNGPTFPLVPAGTVTIDFGREIPAGSEVGFVVKYGSVLTLGVAPTVNIKTYSDSNTQTATGDAMSTTTVINLGLAQGGASVYNLLINKPCRSAKLIFAGVKIVVGATVVNYAYVRPPVELDISSYFTMANGVTYTPAYRFALPGEGEMHITSVQGPAGSTPQFSGNVISNMQVPGNYTVTAEYTKGGVTYTETAIVTRKVKSVSNCNVKLINDRPVDSDDLTKGYHTDYEAYIPSGVDINLIPIEDTDGSKDDVTDNNTENCYILKKIVGVSLGGKRSIIGVKKKDGFISTGKPMRVGFVVNKDATFLNANVLNFYTVTLKKGADVVISQAVNGGVNVSLIKEAGTPKTRFYIEIDDKNLQFDAIELHYTGAIDLSLAQHDLKVYYAFVDNDYVTNKCYDPGEECMQLITNASYNAQASYDLSGLATVGATVTNLGNIIDGNIETFATVAVPLEAATKTVITTTFDPVPGGRAVGFILKNNVSVAELIGVIQIKAYQGENVVADSDGGTALNVTLGSGDYKYVFITPPTTVTDEGNATSVQVDKMELIFGKGLNIGGYNVCGVFTRPDLDGNGLYDCLDDEATTEIRDILVKVPHLCGGENPWIELVGGEATTIYKLRLEDANHSVTEFDVRIGGDGALEPTTEAKATYNAFFANPTNCGVYSVGIYKQGEIDKIKQALLYIHPAYTTWKGNVSGHKNDWNDWGNWDRGVPWECTNVIIPSPENLAGDASYPVLSAGDYRCNNIHIEPMGQIKGQNHLRIFGKVFVDMSFSTGSYHLVSVPLKGMITGDMFGGTTAAAWQSSTLNDRWKNGLVTSGEDPIDIWANYKPYFVSLTPDNYVEDRNSNGIIIYQRFWNQAVRNETLTRAEESTDLQSLLTKTDWSRSFNAVGTEYYLGQCFAMRVGAEGFANGNKNFLFHFPKKHTKYNYFAKTGTTSLKEEAVSHSAEGVLAIGHGAFPESITLFNANDDRLYPFGNPFLAYIHVGDLLSQEAVSNVYRYANKSYTALTSSDYIAPGEGVLMELTDGANAIDFSEDMLEVGTTAPTNAINQASLLHISAMADGSIASCGVNLGSRYHNDYVGGEDALLILPSETQVDVAVYTTSSEGALSLQSFESADRIPLGFYMRKNGDVQLKVTSTADVWNDWYILDEQTGEKHSLNTPTTLHDVESGSGRFFLVKE